MYADNNAWNDDKDQHSLNRDWRDALIYLHNAKNNKLRK